MSSFFFTKHNWAKVHASDTRSAAKHVARWKQIYDAAIIFLRRFDAESSSWETNVLVPRSPSCFKNIFSLFFAERKRSLRFTKFRKIFFYETWKNEVGIQQASGPAITARLLHEKGVLPTSSIQHECLMSFSDEVSLAYVIYLQCCRIANITLRKKVSG